jgi:hypothetical protein
MLMAIVQQRLLQVILKHALDERSLNHANTQLHITFIVKRLVC